MLIHHPIFVLARLRKDFLRLLCLSGDRGFLFRARLSRLSVVLLRLVLGLEAGSTHSISALRVQRVPRAEVSLRKLLAFAEEFDGRIIITEFLMLLADAKVRHNFDRDKVIELEIEAF